MTRYALACLALLMLAPAATASECRPDTAWRLHVSVVGLRNTAGAMAITVYDDRPEKFLAPKGKLLRHRVLVEGTTVANCLALPGPGRYAVAVYHDEDADKDFDRNMFGLPKEGYGFSNDAPTLLGVPSFEDAAFRVAAADTRLTVKLRY